MAALNLPDQPVRAERVVGHRLLNQSQRRLALIVAVSADLLQLPAGLAMIAATLSVVGAAADVPLEGIEFFIDLVAALILNRLMGFHWQLLPSFVLKAVPVIEVAPTWTLCTLYLLRKEKRVQEVSGSGVPPLRD
ncbi:MAG TPA: hypothetical protein VGL42_01950 [Opitutaceae bacterium]|jgi:hypothetical protein